MITETFVYSSVVRSQNKLQSVEAQKVCRHWHAGMNSDANFLLLSDSNETLLTILLLSSPFFSNKSDTLISMWSPLSTINFTTVLLNHNSTNVKEKNKKYR